MPPPSETQISDFVTALATRAPQERVFNPWYDRCRFDLPDAGPSARRARLTRHLTTEPALLIIGEAPGYQGARYSGLAFVSERLLRDYTLPRLSRIRRLTTHRIPIAEPSATIVWKSLRRLGIEDRVVLWNAFPFHPYRDDPLTNRTPRAEDLHRERAIFEQFLALYPGVPVAAVGNSAETALRTTDSARVRYKLRHPANGGATLFANGLTACSDALGITHAPLMLFAPAALESTRHVRALNR